MQTSFIYRDFKAIWHSGREHYKVRDTRTGSTYGPRFFSWRFSTPEAARAFIDDRLDRIEPNFRRIQAAKVAAV